MQRAPSPASLPGVPGAPAATKAPTTVVAPSTARPTTAPSLPADHSSGPDFDPTPTRTGGATELVLPPTVFDPALPLAGFEPEVQRAVNAEPTPPSAPGGDADPDFIDHGAVTESAAASAAVQPAMAPLLGDRPGVAVPMPAAASTLPGANPAMPTAGPFASATSVQRSAQSVSATAQPVQRSVLSARHPRHRRERAPVSGRRCIRCPRPQRAGRAAGGRCRSSRCSRRARRPSPAARPIRTVRDPWCSPRLRLRRWRPIPPSDHRSRSQAHPDPSPRGHRTARGHPKACRCKDLGCPPRPPSSPVRARPRVVTPTRPGRRPGIMQTRPARPPGIMQTRPAMRPVGMPTPHGVTPTPHCTPRGGTPTPPGRPPGMPPTPPAMRPTLPPPRQLVPSAGPSMR